MQLYINVAHCNGFYIKIITDEGEIFLHNKVSSISDDFYIKIVTDNDRNFFRH
jgi:hypothetical protein